MYDQIFNLSHNVGSNNPSKHNFLQLSETYTRLSLTESNEFLKGLMFVFNEAKDKYGENVASSDIHEGVKKVLASLVGQSLMGFPVKFDSRVLED
jgi:hypothetical protein